MIDMKRFPQLFEDPFLFQLVHSRYAEVADADYWDPKDPNTFLVVGKFLPFFRFLQRYSAIENNQPGKIIEYFYPRTEKPRFRAWIFGRALRNRMARTLR